MKRFVKLGSAVAAAALLVTSVTAEARPRWRGYDRGHQVDFGDVLLGAVVLGGVVVGADALAKKNNRALDGTTVDSSRTRRVADPAEDAAVDTCVDAVERQFAATDPEARVDGIDLSRRDGSGWRVEGTIATRGLSRGFVCGARNGRADFVQFGTERSATFAEAR